MRIAVIGSGISGLTAAHILGAHNEVVLYERASSVGMDSHSIDVAVKEKSYRVDVPLRVFSAQYYPNMVDMYSSVGISTCREDYSGCYHDEAGFLFRYINLRLFGLAVPFINNKESFTWSRLKLSLELIKFKVLSAIHLRLGKLTGLTVYEYLLRERFSAKLTDEIVIPVICAICTCTTEAARNYPADIVLFYLSRVSNHPVRRVQNGTHEVVSKLTQNCAAVRCNAQVVSVRTSSKKQAVIVSDINGCTDEFDHVVLATQANQSLSMLTDASPEELEALKAFEYESSRVVVHRDPRLMPSSSHHWSPVNIRVEPKLDKPMATIWLNRALSHMYEAPENVFQTWNPTVEPLADSIVTDSRFERPIINESAVRGWELLEKIQGKRNIWFCGSYARYGMPLLENGVTSAMEIAQRLGSTPSWFKQQDTLKIGSSVPTCLSFGLLCLLAVLIFSTHFIVLAFL